MQQRVFFKFFITAVFTIGVVLSRAQADADGFWLQNGLLHYDLTVELPGTSAQRIYSQTKLFVAKSSRETVKYDLDDKEAGRLIFPAYQEQETAAKGGRLIGTDFRAEIRFKDGKYKITLSGFTGFQAYRAAGTIQREPVDWNRMYEQYQGGKGPYRKSYVEELTPVLKQAVFAWCDALRHTITAKEDF